LCLRFQQLIKTKHQQASYQNCNNVLQSVSCFLGWPTVRSSNNAADNFPVSASDWPVRSRMPFSLLHTLLPQP
jgi:hypothetical protein